jgi:hypothetical protein
MRSYVSEAIVSEYTMVLAHPELKIRKSVRQQLLQLVKNRARIVVPSRLAQITSDPDDNIFLECAGAATGSLLVFSPFSICTVVGMYSPARYPPTVQSARISPPWEYEFRFIPQSKHTNC